MECGSCSIPLPDDARFCFHCGTAAPRSAAAPSDPLRETLKIALGQQYELSRLLGKGGMGAVYLARETALEREVAIKVLPSDRAATAESRDRFRREARTAARLSHPNIVPLHTFGDVDGTMYFVMGYVKGESLAARIRREERLPAEEARRILLEIADALQYAHSLGIVHRDIKPDNVLIEEGTGRAMLTDFGVAKAIGAGQTMTAEGSLLGTPQYMSPEQAQGKSDIDHRSDLYSLGVMAYAMLAGRLPFEGKTTGDVLVQHITKEPPPLKALAPDAPPEMSSAIARCLAKEPAARWPDAKSLRAALSPAEDDELPRELEHLQSFTLATLASAMLLFYLFIWAITGGPVTEAFQIVPAFIVTTWFFTFSLLLTVMIVRARKAGFDFARIRYEMLKQPSKWGAWYPRRYRLTGDVWDRLPAELRRSRASWGVVALTGVFFLIPGFITMFSMGVQEANSGADPARKNLETITSVGLLAPTVISFVVAFVLILLWEKRARTLGIADASMRTRLIGIPTSKRAFWSKPEIAAILVPAGDVKSPSSTHEMAKAVSAAVRDLPEEARAVGAPAVAAAHKLAEAVEAFDKEITALAGTFSPGEAERLQGKISALHGAEEHREVREMLQKQLDLVEGLEQRLEHVKERRARRIELLRMLWLQVAALRSAAGEHANRTSENIIALCSEIGTAIDTGQVTTRRVAISDAPTLKSP